jgi:hypothetical protein
VVFVGDIFTFTLIFVGFSRFFSSTPATKLFLLSLDGRVAPSGTMESRTGRTNQRKSLMTLD